MIRIKILLLTFLLMSCFSSDAQIRIFRTSKGDSDAFRVKVVKNDTVVIADDSAYVYSNAMVDKIGNLEELYLSCLTLRDKDLRQIEMMLSNLQRSYMTVTDLIKRSGNLNRQQLDQFNQQIAEVISNLKADIRSLNDLENKLADSRKELDDLKGEVRKLKRRLWWKKTGGIIVAAVAGFGVGVAVASF